MRVVSQQKSELNQEITVEEVKIEAFIDLGSDVTTIRHSNCLALGWEIQKDPGRVLSGFAGGRCRSLGRVRKKITVGEVSLFTDIVVVNDGSQDVPMILGQTFTNRPGVMVIKKWGEIQILRDLSCSQINEPPPTVSSHAKQMRVTQSVIDMDELKFGKLATQDYKQRLLVLTKSFRSCFAKETSDLGKTNWIEMEINLTDLNPINLRPYRVPYHHGEALRTIVKELLDNNIIENSSSEFASPAMLVSKKDGSFRMCIDFRRLNAVTRKDRFPTPNIEESLNNLSKASVFTSLDFMSGYHQVPIRTECCHLTAFVTPDGHYQYRRMPFGLTNAPAVFMRLMNKIVRKVGDNRLFAYMDDLLIACSSIKETFEVLEKVLNVLREANITLNLKKCSFFNDNVEFLGHEVSRGSIRPGLGKSTVISKYPTPKSVTEVRQFLGLTSYFRRFIKDYAHIAVPLNELLRKDVEFVWTDTREQAFQELRSKLSQRPVLAIYAPNARHELHTDASSRGLAGILLQIGEDELRRPVSYFSRATTPAEQRYHSFELEALAVVESLERFKYYLLGKQFKVVTDCLSLKATQQQKELNSRIARWWLKIQQFDFMLEYRPGAQMCHVDALSRAACSEAFESVEVGNEVLVVNIDKTDWVVILQRKDEELMEIVDILTDENHVEHGKYAKDYTIKQGRLFRKTAEGPRFVVPKLVRIEILRTSHDAIGHPGLDRTVSHLQQTYWFRKMRVFTKKYIDNCMQCAYNKRSNDETHYQLNVFRTEPIPFHTVHIDHSGPYPRSSRQNMHLIGVIDAFTKFVILRPVRTTSANHVLKLLIELSQFFGTPTQLISDRGSAFTSKTFTQYCDDNGIKHIKNAVRTPRANGQIERYFRTVGAAIATTTERADGRDWDSHIHDIQWGLNCLPHKVTGETPQKLLLGYTPKSVLKNQLTVSLHGNITKSVDEDDEIPLEELRQRAADKIKSNREQQADRVNASHLQPRIYSLGDLVLIKSDAPVTGAPRKHLPKFKGPYIVQKVLGKDRYLLTDPPGVRISGRTFSSVYAADRLKRWCDFGNLDLSYLSDDEDGADSARE